MSLKVFRIRKYCGHKGYSHYYYHADVIASTQSAALNAANQNRVNNWRWIDKFDEAESDYSYCEVLYPLTLRDAKNPKRPISKNCKCDKTWCNVCWNRNKDCQCGKSWCQFCEIKRKMNKRKK